MRKVLLNPFFKRLISMSVYPGCRLVIIAILILSTSITLHAQKIKKPILQKFEILNHKTLTTEKTGLMGIRENNTAASYKLEIQNGKHQYKILSNGTTVSIDALSNIEFAQKADRIITYGDSLNKHLASDVYVQLYSGSGGLIKSLGLVASFPCIASLSENGSFIIAGKKSRTGPHEMFIASFDKNGNKQWEKAIPRQIPAGVFNSYNNKYTALVLYDPKTISGSIRYYNATGTLLFTDTRHSSVSGIEFLPNDKVVICSGNVWYLYNMSAGYKLIASGILSGNTIGKYPVTAHPAKDIFFILAGSESSKHNGYALRAFSSLNGILLAESAFGGKIDWQSYRITQVSPDGNIQLLTSQKITTLRMK